MLQTSFHLHSTSSTGYTGFHAAWVVLSSQGACGELQTINKLRNEGFYTSAALQLLPECRSLPATPVKSFHFAFPAVMMKK